MATSKKEEILEQWAQDTSDTYLIGDVIKYPLDLPSIEKQLWHTDEFGDQPFLSDGYQWRDKPHKLLQRAVDEIRELRRLLLQEWDELASEEEG